MKKTIYSFLLVVALASISYTGYYAYSKQATPLLTKESSLPEKTETVEATSTAQLQDKEKLTTSTGKSITIHETNPTSPVMSTITITPSGFATNTPITLEKNKLANFFLLDMDKDSYDELILITAAKESGNYGEVTLFTTKGDLGLTSIDTPNVTEDNTEKGSLFEGYTGNDMFSIEKGILMREFPLHIGTTTTSTSTQEKRKLAYLLTEKDSLYSVTFSKITTEGAKLLSTSTQKTVDTSSRTSTTTTR